MYATATEDMDALTFGTTVLLRNLTASESRYAIFCQPFQNLNFMYFRKLPVREINLDRALADLEMGQTEVRVIVFLYCIIDSKLCV